MCTLFGCFEELVADGFHAADGGMTILLVNVVEFDELHVVVLAYLAHRLVDGFTELGVEQRVDDGLGIALLQHVEQAGEGWTELLAIVFCPVGILVFADGHVCPGIIGTAKHKDDIGITQTIDT